MSKKCQNCGFELADNMNFCPQCHAKFEAQPAVPPPQTPTAPNNVQTPANSNKKIILIVSAIVGVVVVAAVVATAVVATVLIVNGSGNSSTKTAAKTAEKSKYWEIVQKDPKYAEWSNEFKDFKYVKDIVVSDTCVVVCGTATVRGKGECNVAYLLKKINGKWRLVDYEDNWEPKNDWGSEDNY